MKEKRFNFRDELNRRANEEFKKHPHLSAAVKSYPVIEKFDKQSKNYIVYENPAEKKNKKQLNWDKPKFKDDFFNRLSLVYRACLREFRTSPLIALSKSQRKLCIFILRKKTFSWKQLAIRSGLTIKELRVDIQKVNAFLKRYLSNGISPKIIENKLLDSNARKAQQNDKWKYMKVELSMPPITKSKWIINKKILSFMEMDKISFNDLNEETKKILSKETIVKLPRVSKNQFVKIKPMLRRHGIKFQGFEYNLPYGEALLRASI